MSPARPGCAGTVLVVDDEEIVRRVLERVLARAGYTMLGVSDGASAIDVLRQRAGDVDLVVLDLTMPGMSGLETYRGLRQVRADVPVLLMSGYDESESTGGFEDLAGFLSKPLLGEEILRKVASAMEARPGVP